MEVCVLIIVILFFYLMFSGTTRNTRSDFVVSDIDNRVYLVKNGKNKKLSANTLATINNNVLLLLNSLKKESNEKVKNLLNRYNPDNLIENIDSTGTSYVLNKGEEIGVCLSTKDSKEEIYDTNTLMFVVIHELAHIGCDSYGKNSHDKEYIEFFSFLLKKAIQVGIYTYQDYSMKPVEYCGIIINKTPV
ncbi:MAG TPA: hypothetical protein V6C58_14095 [Allocoleopsis sp.]